MPLHPVIPTPPTPEYFDYRSEAKDAGVSTADLGTMIRIFELDYPNDLMLRELHVLRACIAIRAGRAKLKEILRDAPSASAA